MQVQIMQEEIIKRYKHNPPHVFQSHCKYFVTGAAYLKTKYFTSANSKEIILNCIRKGCDKYQWILEDWVILDNHYHIMLCSPKNAFTLSQMMKEIHVFSSIKLRRAKNAVLTERKIFHNYWDTCISYEGAYFSRLNYIYMNPVKHGYVKDPQEYIWSSYNERLKMEEEYLKTIQKKFPCGGVNVKDDF